MAASFRSLSEGTPEEFKIMQTHFAKVVSSDKMTDRICGMLEDLKGVNIGCTVDLYEHSLQSATRALRDGADEETVVCALVHDIGECHVPACHGEVAGALLRPYISPMNYWILVHHEIFQAFYYGDAMGIDKNIRDRYKDHPYYAECEKFCGRYDETAFDPDYDSLPLSEFRPMIKRILERKPYSVPGMFDDTAAGADDAKMNRAKADLSVYDFDEWHAKH